MDLPTNTKRWLNNPTKVGTMTDELLNVSPDAHLLELIDQAAAAKKEKARKG
jgi:hypothetical protein